MTHHKLTPTSLALAEMLKADGTMLEFARAACGVVDLINGVDLFRTRPNEVSLIGGRTSTYQLWQSVRLTSDPQTSTLAVALSLDNEIVQNLRPVGKHRLERALLVKAGSVVRATARDPKATSWSLISVEIFGWELLDAWLPSVEEALRLLEVS